MTYQERMDELKRIQDQTQTKESLEEFIKENSQFLDDRSERLYQERRQYNKKKEQTLDQSFLDLIKKGNLYPAMDLFDIALKEGKLKLQTDTFNAMLTALTLKGRTQDIKKIVEYMNSKGIKPDPRSLEGKYPLPEIKKKIGIIPELMFLPEAQKLRKEIDQIRLNVDGTSGNECTKNLDQLVDKEDELMELLSCKDEKIRKKAKDLLSQIEPLTDLELLLEELYCNMHFHLLIPEVEDIIARRKKK